MSRGNILQGQASGKLGDAVLMVRNGQQLARVYTKAGSRSGKDASEAARIQRVKFGSASNQWSLYRYVCTRMFRKGRKSTQSDYNYFVKRNASLLPYFTKQENADGAHVLMPGTMSEGNLGRIDIVHRIELPITEADANLFIYDSNVSPITSVSYNAVLGTLKSALATAYPSARKITYLLSYAKTIEIEEEGSSFVSQSISHDTITIDLYKEVVSGENEMTVKEYFSQRVSSTTLSALFNRQGGSCVFDHNVLMVKAFSTQDLSLLENLGVLFFATDDNVSDCYTTVLSENSVNPTNGVYALWASYRTPSSMRVACDSYGYQGGVMRDEVASVGNDIQDAVVQYAARLSAVDPNAGASFLKSIGNPADVKAKVVRVATAANKEG